MRCVIASSSSRNVDECRDFLGIRSGLAFRCGSVSSTGWDCDVAILNWPLAHDRYGGEPEVGKADILNNWRADGAPKVIVATPPVPMKDASKYPTDAKIERYVYRVLDDCMAAYENQYGRGNDSAFLVHLEAAGIDRVDLAPPLRGIATFLVDIGII